MISEWMSIFYPDRATPYQTTIKLRVFSKLAIGNSLSGLFYQTQIQRKKLVIASFWFSITSFLITISASWPKSYIINLQSSGIKSYQHSLNPDNTLRQGFIFIFGTLRVQCTNLSIHKCKQYSRWKWQHHNYRIMHYTTTVATKIDCIWLQYPTILSVGEAQESHQSSPIILSKSSYHLRIILIRQWETIIFGHSFYSSKFEWVDAIS